MRSREDPLVALWLEKAVTDLRMAELALQEEPPLFEQAMFHAQQAGEKALKGLLVAVDQPVPRTHDCVQVLEHVLESMPDLAAFADDAAFLTQFAVLPRYPGFCIDDLAADARDAYVRARRLVDAAAKVLP
jgi:HEPN domain-containing protein